MNCWKFLCAHFITSLFLFNFFIISGLLLRIWVCDEVPELVGTGPVMTAQLHLLNRTELLRRVTWLAVQRRTQRDSSFQPCFWLSLKPRGTFRHVDHSEQPRGDDSEPEPKLTHRQPNVRTPFGFTCFLICSNCVIFIWEKEWPEHACLSFCYLR